MKNKILLVLVLGLFVITGCGNNENNVLNDINKELSKQKTYKELEKYYDKLDKKVENNKLSISIKNGDDKKKYDFILDGDYIKVIAKKDDYYANMLFLEMAKAVAAYNSMDLEMINSYIYAVFNKDIEQKYIKNNINGDNVTYSIYYKGKFDMSELKNISITDKDLELYDSFGDEYISFAGIKGNYIYNGSGDKNSSSIILGERDGFTDKTINNLLIIIDHFYPEYADLVRENYTELGEKEIDKLSIKYVTDEKELSEKFNVDLSKCKFIKISFNA